jgi:hypothetical protein
MTMQVTTCNRCSNWQKVEQRCNVYMGCEHEPEVPSQDIPRCPLETRCQHQLQKNPAPCIVRARGQVCESVVGECHPLAFNANDY